MDTEELLDKYREFTANSLCKCCRKEYKEQFNGIDCEVDNGLNRWTMQ